MSFKVAVVGATGNVGREMLNVLAERQFPAREVVALASTRSVGTEVSFGDRILKVKALDYYDFKGTDIALMAAGSAVSKPWAPKIAAAGAFVIDNASCWRLDREVPLVVPEVNAHDLDNIKKGIVANPNCAIAQLVVALKPLHDEAAIKRVVVATYQSVSGAGCSARPARCSSPTPSRPNTSPSRSPSTSSRTFRNSTLRVTPTRNSR